ncbi:MAG: FMN-binding protein [Tissierellia bacterium]|nr:FMN-binding protein [Tissierellia bacterium]
MDKRIIIIIMALVMSTMLLGCGKKEYQDGIHEGEAFGYNDEVKIRVAVEVEEGKIKEVKILEHDESVDALPNVEDALENIPKEIVAANTHDVDGISGATMTSDGIKKAVIEALK